MQNEIFFFKFFLKINLTKSQKNLHLLLFIDNIADSTRIYVCDRTRFIV